MKSSENGQAVSEKKTFKEYTILYMYMAQGQGQITPEEQNFNCYKKKYMTLITYCKFQPLVFITRRKQFFNIQMYGGTILTCCKKG